MVGARDLPVHIRRGEEQLTSLASGKSWTESCELQEKSSSYMPDDVALMALTLNSVLSCVLIA